MSEYFKEQKYFDMAKKWQHKFWIPFVATGTHLNAIHIVSLTVICQITECTRSDIK
jgi:hypothetical protein